MMSSPSSPSHSTPLSEVLLVSSPGFGVIDSGCGRTIVGQETLKEFEQLWRAKGIPVPAPFSEVNHFKFGNGQRETTDSSVKLPVVIAGRSGSIKAAIVKGSAPLLISRNALQLLEAVVNFGRNELSLFSDQITVPLTINAAGQYAINLLDQVGDLKQPSQEVLMNATTEPSKPSEPSSPAQLSADMSAGPDSDLQTWTRTDSFLNHTVTTGKQGPAWQSVRLYARSLPASIECPDPSAGA
ncbi:unnamed protein product [Cladocopium goreaui]|uniref:Transposon protein n=1 Tax=Cladocopium goreaui TaxID=2562237 RepID=A0A9P1CT85_9DINO|nr:unnamed protein product [Cladocopium goreaui]